MRALALFPLLLIATSATAQTTAPVFDTVESGLLCPTVVVGERDAPETISGILRLIDADQPIAVRTDIVPRLLGAEFGVRSILKEGVGPIAAEVVVTHPPMGPSGQTVERWTTELSADSTSIVAFTFERPEELVGGAWTFELRAEGQVLLERSFAVVDGPTLDYQKLCEGPPVVS